MRGRPTLVLVHSPLVGPSSWQPVARELRARGHVTIIPSAEKVFGGAVPYYPRLATAIANEIDRHDDAQRIMLIGHSGAGALLPAIANTTTATVVGTIFVDALLPHPGHSWFDTAPAEIGEQLRELVQDGLLPPWNEWFPQGTLEALLPDPATRDRFREELPRLPLSYFEELAPEAPESLPFRSAYLRLSDAYSDEALQAEKEGWWVRHRPTHHLAVLARPRETSAAIAALIDDIER